MDTTILGLTKEEVRLPCLPAASAPRCVYAFSSVSQPEQPTDSALRLLPRPSLPQAQAKPYIASMGIYVFKKSALLELLNKTYPRANDFGSEIIPAAAEKMKVQAYLFNDYWEDIGTIRSFFDANLNLAKSPPNFEFYDATNPIYTSSRFLPPAKARGALRLLASTPMPLPIGRRLTSALLSLSKHANPTTLASLCVAPSCSLQLIRAKVKDAIISHGAYITVRAPPPSARFAPILALPRAAAGELFTVRRACASADLWRC